ncbi:hypothetical protein CHS0354_031378 [Potamilus streckersoni]|uniref:Chitin-binding type-2 domain-containing protein n=1 Tax=Potamilus streckersoni TaxID=2493646 RepID=A0AAE0SJY5_9BIVA|nr:hypothetical protein CHS0354_031378 [Potamilus streckersoni]
MDTFIGTVVSFLCLLISSREVLSQTTADSCIDISGIVQDGQTCTQLIASQHGMCYDTVVNIMCCQTCRNKSTGIQGCEFGDLSPNCNLSLCDQYPDPTLCCGTCNARVMTSTEATTKSACSSNQFQCQQNGACISLKQRCDGFPDCQDRSDETGTDCFGGLICNEGLVACTDGTQCIPKELVCDGIPNCRDFSDENSTICPANGTTTLSSTISSSITTASTITATTSKATTTMNTTIPTKEVTSTILEKTTNSPKTISGNLATTTISLGTEATTVKATKEPKTFSMRTSTTRVPITTQQVNATTQPITVATKNVPTTNWRAIVTTTKRPNTTQRLTQATKKVPTTARRAQITSERAPVTFPSISFTTQRPVVMTQRPPCISLPFRSWMCNSIYRGYFPNVADDCKSFYVCEWGYLYYCQCPFFTRFSRSSLVCDWASSVSCDAD